MLPTTWKTDTFYAVDDMVLLYGEQYTCRISHKSNFFGKDLHDHGYWYHPKSGPHREDLSIKNDPRT